MNQGFNGKKLKELRVNNGLTQQQLGNLVNVTKVSICCYENDNRTPNLDTLIDLCKALNTTPNYLLDMEAILMVSENNGTYELSVSKRDVEILETIKNNKELYDVLYESPKKSEKVFRSIY